jgi:hypothetical protein
MDHLHNQKISQLHKAVKYVKISWKKFNNKIAQGTIIPQLINSDKMIVSAVQDPPTSMLQKLFASYCNF